MRGELFGSRPGAVVLVLLAVSALLVTRRGWGQQATLVGDAHVSSAQPAVNAGTLSNLDVGGADMAMMQFDLGVLPAGTTAAQITKATLRVYCNRADVPGTVAVAAIGGAWTESAITYATLPVVGATVQTAQVTGAGEFVTFDVTTEVQAWVSAPVTNFGLALEAPAGSGTVVQFDSKENDQTAHAPELEIALAAGGTGTIGATGATGATGQAGPQGPMGPQGLQGIPGATGATGATGAMGATGAAGATGPQGPSGSGGGGIAYLGTYSGTTAYQDGDVVQSGGSSWVSMMAANVGNLPEVGSLAWGLLAAAGTVGATGAVGPQGAVGTPGPQGPQGTAGTAGAQGIPGTTGAAGLQGPAGPQGAAGPVGLSFVGAYDSTVNYGLGAGVLWEGAGWVSLLAENHGNTPSLSPNDWAMFAASGSPGVTGAMGPAGTPGVNGANGATGATGPQGPVGPMGAAGSPGLVYEGAYRPGANYVLGDVVVFDGASWVSLAGQNVGQTPSLSPQYWGALTSVGPQGPVGATGAQGAVGSQGVQGLVGAPGPQGVAGPIGIQGPAGAQGLTGAMGAVGSAGPQGLQGVPGAAGSPGIPGSTGATGLQGPAGPAGATGLAGPAGANGTNGSNGTPGLQWEGAWSSAMNYALDYAVSYGGSSWLSLTANNVGQRPDLYPQAWAVLAQEGTAGVAGVAGAVGATGPQGPAGSPGAAGVTGATGATGAPGLNFAGVWSAARYYAVNDAVTFGGSTYLAQVAESNEEPDLFAQAWAVLAQAGSVGAAGATGAAATMSVGTVTTLAAGSQATVTNTGTAQAAVLNFGIPQGATGASGGSGTGSGTFAAMYHAVSDATLFYSVNAPTASATETGGAVLAWVPQGCTATELNVYSQQTGAITVTLRTGVVGAMAGTALSCSPATNGSCKALGSVAIAAGEFIDLGISAASGSTAGVWTSLECQ